MPLVPVPAYTEEEAKLQNSSYFVLVYITITMSVNLLNFFRREISDPSRIEQQIDWRLPEDLSTAPIPQEFLDPTVAPNAERFQAKGGAHQGWITLAVVHTIRYMLFNDFKHTWKFVEPFQKGGGGGI
jgi:hypothetical protein